MTTPGRPKNDTARPLTSFGLAVAAALDARRAAMAEGPRTLADLARLLGCSPQQLNHAMKGTRKNPSEAAIRAALPEVSVSMPPDDQFAAALLSLDQPSRALAVRGRHLVETGKKPRSQRDFQAIDMWGVVVEISSKEKV